VRGMVRLLGEVYGAFTALVSELPDEDFARRTRAEAWSLRELLLHQLLDAQRALVAFASPTGREPDVDELTYWTPFRPSEGDGGAAHAAFVVRAAAAYDGPGGLVDQWRTTAAAAVRAAAAAPPAGRVETQGHVIAVPDLVSTLVTEATIHLLDATLEVPGAVPPDALAHTRRVLEGIRGGPLAPARDDVEAVLQATGRLPADDPAYPLLG
jgi:hypothetical protein